VVRDVATPVSRGGVLHDLTSPPRDLTSPPLDVTSSPLISVRSVLLTYPISIYIMYHLTCFRHTREGVSCAKLTTLFRRDPISSAIGWQTGRYGECLSQDLQRILRSLAMASERLLDDLINRRHTWRAEIRTD
jgi:hypothetical protein